MSKTLLSILLIITLGLTLLACSSNEENNTTANPPGLTATSPVSSITPGGSNSTTLASITISQPAVDTGFTKMLEYLPAPALGANLCFIDWLKFKKLNQIEDITSLSEYYKLVTLRQRTFTDLSPFSQMKRLGLPSWTEIDVTDNIGFDVMGIDQMLYIQWPPSTSILEISFDEEKITGFLTQLGYQAIKYRNYSYFDIKGENKGDRISQILVGRSMNQIAVLNNKIIVAPSIKTMTATLDALSGNTPNVADTPGSRAVANSLRDMLNGIILLPENIFNKTMPYHFTIPADWGSLHQYTLAGMGYRNDGKQTHIDIALYYSDITEARGDGKEVEIRVKDYVFNTQPPPNDKNPPLKRFTDLFELEEPEIQAYDSGAVLKLSCRLIPDGRKGMDYIISGTGLPDVLFLAPDPAQYLAP